LNLGFLGDAALDPALSLMLRWGLALILAQAAIHKARDLPRFRNQLAGYQLLPTGLTRSIATLLVGAEAALGIALLFPSGPGARAPLAAALLLSGYAAAIAINLARGRRDFDCGCMGPHASRPVGSDLIVRNCVLIALAGIASLPLLTRQFVWLDYLTAAAGAGVLALLHASAETALANLARTRTPAESGSPRPAASWSVVQ